MTAPAAPPCPCDSGLSYAVCCGRWHSGPLFLQAPSAEALMRSRYAAFVQDRLDYLLRTWHPSSRPASLEPTPPGLKWLGLRIIRHEPPTPQAPDRATVEFIARYRQAGKAARLHETSRFVRMEGHWFYLDGDVEEKTGGR